MGTKKGWKSKTLWFNVLMAVLATAEFTADMAWLSPEALATIIVVGNFILRTWFTKLGLTK